MDPQILLRKPKPVPTVTAKISKIDSLKLISNETKKTSIKLRKIFEQGSYQKKTQLSILKRYKKKLDSLEKTEEERQRKLRQRSQKKFQLPKIKNFTGSFFTPNASDNPLKAIGLLAAFNAVDSAIQKDFSKAIGPALVASGLLFGPGLLSLGLTKFGRGKPSPQATTPGGVSPKPPLNPSSLSRANQSYSKFISGQADIGDRSRLVRRGYITPKQAFSKGGPQALAATEPGKVSKAFARFGGSIIPGVGAVVGATDSVLRAQSGDVSGSAIAGTAAALDAYAAASAATVVGLPLAGLASIASFTLDVVNLVRDLTGASASEQSKNKDRLKEQTKKQKELIIKQKEESEGLSFSKTLNSYEKSIKKFEEFSKGFRLFDTSETKEQTQRRASNIENLIGDQDIIPEPGYEFTNYTSQYLTGDPSSPAYDESHGTSSNYHDHIAFKDRNLAIRAYQFLESKGLDVTEFEGFDPVGGHTEGSAHYSGLAFDVPGYQWGASGPIDERHYNGSRKVRQYLNEFFESEKRTNPNLTPKTTNPQPRTSPSPQTQPQKMVSGMQDLRNIQKTLSNRSVPFEVDGKKYFFRIKPDGGVEVFKPKNLIGYQEPIDISKGTNLFIKKAIDKKLMSMFPASAAALTPVPSTPTLPAPVTQIPISSSRPTTISQTMSYEQPSPYSQQKPMVVPIPIPPTPKSQTIITPQGSSIMMMSGPSEEELLNSFYKRVLLNTLV